MTVKLERKRYLKVEFYGKPPEIGKLVYELRKKIRDLAGEIFLAKASLYVVELTDTSAIIRTTHLARDTVEAAIQLICDETYIAVVRRVSGTIKALAKHLEEEDEEEPIKEDYYYRS